MSTSISGTGKKSRGRPPKGATSLHVRVPPDEIAALDQAIGAASDDPSRPEMVRRAVAEWLRERGYLNPGERT